MNCQLCEEPMNITQNYCRVCRRMVCENCFDDKKKQCNECKNNNGFPVIH